MRRKSMLITLIGCLLVSVCCVFGTGCGTNKEEHTHAFDGIVITASPTKTEYTAFEEFSLDGIKVEKHCTGDGCEGEEVANSDITFAYEKEGATKLTADMTKVIIKVGEFTADQKVTVNKIKVTLPTIDGKVHNGEKQVATVEDSDFYTVTENEGGTDIGEYDVKLTLKDSVNYAFDGVEGNVATVKFNIEFNTEVTESRQDILLTADTNAIKLTGISSYKSVKSISYGEINLGTDIDALTIDSNAINADGIAHGEQNLTVVVTGNDDKDYTVSVPVTLITKSISTFSDLQDTVTVKAKDQGKYQDGKYYILANDIDMGSTKYASGSVTWDNPGSGFAGTLDGRNHTLDKGYMAEGGIFGALEGATVKNIKFTNLSIAKYVSTAHEGRGTSLISGTVRNSTIENIEVAITDNSNIDGSIEAFGIIASFQTDANTVLKNIKIDATGSILSHILGKHTQSVLPTTIEGVEVKATYLDSVNGVAGVVDVDGIAVKMGETVTVDSAIDPLDLDMSEVKYALKTAYQNLEIEKVLKGDTEISKELYVINESKEFYIENPGEFISSDDYEKTIALTIIFKGTEGSDIKLVLNVNVLGLQKKVTLATRRDVVLKASGTENTTFTLDLGTDYSTAVISKVTFGENKEITNITNNAITITDDLKNATHGEQNLTVYATMNNKEYLFTVPVTIVTASITTWDDLTANVTFKSGCATKYQEGKYFILASDISTTTYNISGRATTWGSGFAGTLDGRGNKISGGTMYGGGLFGVLNGGTIKNIKFEIGAGGANGNRTVLAEHISSATLIDVEIKITGDIDMTNQTSNPNGLIGRGHVLNLTMTNVTIDATGSKLGYVISSGSGVDIHVTATNVVVKADAVAHLAKKGSDIDEYSGITIELTNSSES